MNNGRQILLLISGGAMGAMRMWVPSRKLLSTDWTGTQMQLWHGSIYFVLGPPAVAAAWRLLLISSTSCQSHLG